MTTEVRPVPNLAQLESVQKAMAIPTVGAAVGQVGALYSRVKGAHSLLEWAFSTAEAGVALAATTAVPYVATPLAHADTKVAAAIVELERRVPILSEQPKVILDTTKQAVMSKVSPHVNKVCTARAAAGQRVKSLKELSWTKANALLSTACGQKALESVDSGAVYAMKLLDHYLPAQNEEQATEEIVPAATDPALHTVQTVGRLSAVAARRVWANLAGRLQQLKQAGIELDPRRYVAALLAALHLADFTRRQQQHDQQQQQQQAQQVPQQQQQQQEGDQVTPQQSSPSKTEQSPQKGKTTPPKSNSPKK